MVIPRGFEPRTHSLEGCCSIQLSYGTILWGCKDSENNSNSYLGERDSSNWSSWATASLKPFFCPERGKLSVRVPPS